MTPPDIVVDQALHGYDGGHRLLAGSSKLTDDDARAMLVLSDASGGRSGQDERGYVTGYPLASSQRYVLARTWPATEMSRPGCVWTHSILIGFADLAVVVSARGLLAEFRRPSSAMSSYDLPLCVGLEGAEVTTTAMHGKAGSLLAALYLDPSSKVEMRAGDPNLDETLILAAWLQQWPRLRRTFRFCSSIGADRSTTTQPFDLQAATAGSPRHGMVRGGVLVDSTPEDPRLAGALEDLRHPNGLQSFLRRVGGDVRGGRAAMLPLSQLYHALEVSEHQHVDFETALSALQTLGSDQARAARLIMLERALSCVDSINDTVFQAICEHIVDADALDDAECHRLGMALWRKSATTFAHSLSEAGPLGRLAAATIALIDAEELIGEAIRHPSLVLTLVGQRPDILANARLWEGLPAVISDQLLTDNKLEGDRAFIAVVAADRSDLASRALRQFGAARILSALGEREAASPERDRDLSPWLRQISQQPKVLGTPMSSGGLPRRVVAELAKHVEPDAVPNDYGQDPWVTAACAPGDLGRAEEDKFATFLMARGLGRRSKSSALLLKFSFDRVHAALADDTMPDESWRLIEPRLIWPRWWSDWDRCRRVRETVTAKFIDYELEPTVFGWLTNSGSAFDDMVAIAEDRRDGRRFLERVRKGIRSESEPFMQARTKKLSRYT